MHVKKDILYPWFLECCSETNDKFWKNIFEDLAYGIAPCGTYIYKNFLCFKTKNNDLITHKLERENKSNTQIFNIIYNSLKNDLGLLSNFDNNKKKMEIKNIQQINKQKRENWNTIRKNNIKNNLLEQYVIDIKNKYKLSLKKTKRLLSVIFINLMFKNITAQDIIICNGKIQNIKGFVFIHKDFKFNNFSHNIPIINNDVHKEKISLQWDKYIKEIYKKN